MCHCVIMMLLIRCCAVLGLMGRCVVTVLSFGGVIVMFGGFVAC